MPNDKFKPDQMASDEKFKPGQFTVKEEYDAPLEPRVVKLDVPTEPVVQQYNFGRIRKEGEGDYQATKAKYGPLAATDPERQARTQRDSRFSINPLLRDPLSVEEEERRVIEEKVRSRVAAMADEARAKAAEEGFQQGQAKGYEDAFAQFKGEGAERLARFEAMVKQAESAKESIFKQNERFLIDLVFRVSRMILLRELATDRDYVVRLCRELIERVGVRENIRIRIHPDEASTIGMIREGLEKTFGSLKNLHIEISNQVQVGGCMLETEWNAIDASLENQLKAVSEALLGQGEGTAK